MTNLLGTGCFSPHITGSVLLQEVPVPGDIFQHISQNLRGERKTANTHLT